MKNITIYSIPECPYCRMVKEYLKEKGLKFNDINVNADEKAAEEMVEKSGQMGVPVIEIGDRIILGFQRQEIDAALSL